MADLRSHLALEAGAAGKYFQAMSGRNQLIYKIAEAEAWRDAERTGTFRGAAIDLADGFIHFSTAEQVAETAAKHFKGRGDLVVAAVDAGLLGDVLKWEPARGGALFPHLYAPLPLTAVAWVRAVPLGPDGEPAAAGVLR